LARYSLPRCNEKIAESGNARLDVSGALSKRRRVDQSAGLQHQIGGIREHIGMPGL
jgi:hypothetical protein